ncbi:acyltransferase family protein [Pseudomonas sp. NPDC090202]|uniref:acyltransferase family protein n=1 Tax=unclassified Pseudomonas TaxID=196821 RepID=UPI00382DA1F9
MHARMPERFSLYLDLLRLLAAAVVALSHYPLTASQAAITDRYNFGYDAVIIFFVLSGYVISHAVDAKETDGLTYSINRIARIFPVALTAVVLSLGLMIVGNQYAPHLYPDAFQLEAPLYYLSRTLFFTNEFWWEDIRPFGNGPYWSLAFEVWCYIIYGLAVFTRGRWRVALILLALLITGPKQWVMLPIWFAGVLAYHCRDKFRPSSAALWLMCLCPIIVFLLVQLNNPRDWSYPLAGAYVEQLLGHGLDGAANFGWGYILALLVSVHLFAVRQLTQGTQAQRNGRLATTVRTLAGYTFSLYIYHYPLMIFWQALASHDRDFYDPLLRTLVYVGVVVPVFILGYWVERRKQRIRRAIFTLFDIARRLMAVRTP